MKTDNWQSSSAFKTQQLNSYQNNFNPANDINKYPSQTVMADRFSPSVQVPQIAKTQPPQPVTSQIPFSSAQNNSTHQSSQVSAYNKDIFYNPKTENNFNVGTYTSSKV